MGLEDAKLFINKTKKENLPEEVKDKSKFITVVKKLVIDVEKTLKEVEILSNQKIETTNLKNSYKDFCEQTNLNYGIINARVDNLENSLKDVLKTLKDLEDI